MINILIPTDFSAASKSATRYGLSLAKTLDAEVHLVTMIQIEIYAHSGAAVKMMSIEEQMNLMAERDMQKFLDELRKEFPDSIITTEILRGQSLHSALDSCAAENGTDMIVMGTHGASGIIGNIMGSNASAVIAHSAVPVLTIPPETVYNEHPKIILTSDLQNLEPKIRIIAPLAAILETEIILFHVSTDGTHQSDEEELIRSQLSSEFSLPGIKVKIVQNTSIEAGIESFAVENQPCLIAMFTHKPGFFQKMFGKSITRKTVLHTQVPLLTLKH
ncbi:MAG: universal stress protein [Bacteroidia bacterium]|nr:universal stress protein [Bacteroidia bacterium]MCZ2277902.1 universal stress protein [Bacteroidia bacterium]